MLNATSRFFCAAFVLSVVCSSAMAQAQMLWGNARYGMSPSELREALPDIEPVARPPGIANGARGLYRQTRVDLAGASFDAWFYFKAQRLEQVELLYADSVAPVSANALYQRIVTQLSGRYGSPLLSDDHGLRSASWVAGDVDVAVVLSATSLRVLYKPRVLQNADAL